MNILEDKSNLEKELLELEMQMNKDDFWLDKNRAQEIIRRISELKNKIEGIGKYDKGNAIVSIISGAGGDDAEDFSRILLQMYMKFCEKNDWEIFFINEQKNDKGGYRNVSFEIKGNRVYGKLKNENGVHRLVRLSPFNSKKLRHTSFSLVEVLPKFNKFDEKDFVLKEEDLKIEFLRSGGPGGQNVNKRETAVRIIHKPTNISVLCSNERSQEANRDEAMNIIRAKIFRKSEKENKSFEETMKINIDKDIEWGNQIRSYVMHPYKMVKDHRTGVETAQIDNILEGNLELFIENKKDL